MEDSDDESPLCIPDAIKEDICDDVMKNLVDDAILGICFEAHRLMKAGVFPDDPKIGEYEIVHEDGCDIFGSTINDNCLSHTCNCTNCGRTMGCSTFARHFHGCKEGRRRTAAKPTYVNFDNGGTDADGKIDSTEEEDNEADLDYQTRGSKKNSRKKGKPGRGKKKASSKPK